MTVPPLHQNFIWLFDWVWQTSAKVSVLIILLLLVKTVLKKKIGAHLNYLLWFIVIAGLLLPWTPHSSFSLYNLTNLETQKVYPATLTDNTQTLPRSGLVKAGSISGAMGSLLDQIDVVQNPPVLFSIYEAQTSIVTFPFIHKLLFFIWLMGVVAFITAIGLVNRRFGRRLKGQFVVNAKVYASFVETKSRLSIKAEIPLIQSTAVKSPSLFGLFRPRLLIPADILDEFTSEQLSHVFMHELLHFKRRDILINWLAQGLLVLHWFNPILWYAFYRLREDQEIACDAKTIESIGLKDAKEYAFTLIKLAESNVRMPNIVSLAGLLGSGSQIRRRITMIKVNRKMPIIWALLVVALAAIISFITLTNAKADTTNHIGIANSSSANTAGTVAVVANTTPDKTFPQDNSAQVQIEPNKLVSNEGWSLTITKVASLGASKLTDLGWHSPFKESDAKRSYAVFFTAENSNGKDKAFLPKGRVLGIVGDSGKYYDFYRGANNPNNSLDKWYSGEHWDSLGWPYKPGVFQFSTGADVELNESGITKVVYQDENGTKYEIRFQGTITVSPDPIDTTSKRVAKLYGESNPKIVKVNNLRVESTDALGFIVFLEGSFNKDGKHASALEFSMLADGTKVWAVRGYNESGGQDIWIDNQVSI